MLAFLIELQEKNHFTIKQDFLVNMNQKWAVIRNKFSFRVGNKQELCMQYA